MWNETNTGTGDGDSLRKSRRDACRCGHQRTGPPVGCKTQTAFKRLNEEKKMAILLSSHILMNRSTDWATQYMDFLSKGRLAGTDHV